MIDTVTSDRRTLVGPGGSLLGVGAKVTAMEGLGRATNETRTVYDLWVRARNTRRFPRVADLPLHELGRLQESMGVIDVVPGKHDYRYRTCGALEIALRGSDPCGRTVRECHSGEILDFVLDSFDRVLKSRDGVIDFSVDIDRNQRYIATEVILLPLSEDDSTIDSILAYIHYRDTGKAG